MYRKLGLAVIVVISVFTVLGQKNNPKPNIFRIEALTAYQIDALDRNKTLFLLPVGMLEQHGPHLPIGSDTYWVDYGVESISKRLSKAHPDWNIVLMPSLNYGEGGANEIGNIQVHPGTYGIRQTTLRSVVADIGGQIAQNKFKWIFVIHGHGAPTHNIAISEASDFVSATFKVTMLNITSIAMADAKMGENSEKIAAKYYSPAERASFGIDIHAGLSETSGMLGLHPGLVDPIYKTLPGRTGANFGELRQIALTTGWQGYFSSPAKANAAYGKEDTEVWIDGATGLILSALRGENLFGRPRYPVQLENNPATIQINKDALENEKIFEAKLEQWLQRRKTLVP
jgi:creatinine amidohydrolase/Fe(II)-dependent formamide hydrolase-like protein